MDGLLLVCLCLSSLPISIAIAGADVDRMMLIQLDLCVTRSVRDRHGGATARGATTMLVTHQRRVKSTQMSQLESSQVQWSVTGSEDRGWTNRFDRKGINPPPEVARC